MMYKIPKNKNKVNIFFETYFSNLYLKTELNCNLDNN